MNRLEKKWQRSSVIKAPISLFNNTDPIRMLLQINCFGWKIVVSSFKNKRKYILSALVHHIFHKKFFLESLTLQAELNRAQCTHSNSDSCIALIHSFECKWISIERKSKRRDLKIVFLHLIVKNKWVKLPGQLLWAWIIIIWHYLHVLQHKIWIN